MSLKLFLICVACSFVAWGTAGPKTEVFCGLGYFPKNDNGDYSGNTPFTKCVGVGDNVSLTEGQCTPTFTGGIYAGLNRPFTWGGVRWSSELRRCVKNDCESVSKDFIPVDFSVLSKQKLVDACLKIGCLPDTRGKKCYPMEIITLVVIILLSVIGLSVLICFIISVVNCCYKMFSCCCCVESVVEKVEPIDSRPSTASARSNVVLSGPFVVIKLGSQKRQTKKVKNGPELKWGETFIFANVGPEDDEVIVELWNDAWLVGSESLRILPYVNKKTSVFVNVKDTAGEEAGVVEVDVDVQFNKNNSNFKKVVFFVERGKIGVMTDVVSPVYPASTYN